MAITATTIIVSILMLVLPIVLQVVLSRLESPIPGLILPILCLVGSLWNALFLAVVPSGTSPAEVIIPMLLTGNVPTLVLLLIYFACRGKHRRKKQMDKMNIQDLD